MNRNQTLALVIAGTNIIVMLMFPPVDVYAVAQFQIPVFGGFEFILDRSPHSVVNADVLFLEIFVVLINAGVAWLLLRTRQTGVTTPKFSLQGATLVVMGINLVLILLFPPFESVYSVTRAIIPSFEGFYCIFLSHPHHVIVTIILYIETIFVLINGALFWLLFRGKKPHELTPEELLARMMVARQRRAS